MNAGVPAAAQAAETGAVSVDTEHMLGFTEGTDIGLTGEREFIVEANGSLGRAGGYYRQLASTFELKYVAAENFRVSAAASLAYYDTTGVSGIDDRRNAALQSLSFSARYHALDRASAPIGLTLSIEPRLGFVDDVIGARVDGVGADFLAMVDRELVPGRLFGALNMSYAPARTRLRASGETAQESTFGRSAALSLDVTACVFVGAEVRYLSRYAGLALNDFSGQALYVGPTAYAVLGNGVLLSLAWDIQAWGHAARRPGALDLVNFERHQAKLRLGTQF